MSDKLVPSKPFKNYADIEYLAVQAKGKVERIQVDICDGEYVKNVSWPFTETSKTDFANLYQKKELDVFMPGWEDLEYTADLMCRQPENYIETLVAYGFSEIIIHYRSVMSPPLFKGDGHEVPGNFSKAMDLCQKYDLKLYFAIDVKTDLSEFIDFVKVNLEKYPNTVSGVQIMGIENIGQQGQEFDERSLDIVKAIYQEIKLGNENFKILFDGGINEENLEEIKNAGIDVFCIGHLLTDGDFADNLRYIKKVLEY